MAVDLAPSLRPLADRRRRSRLTARGVAIIRTQRARLLADTVDISAHGVCLSLPRALEVGSTCRLDLEIRFPATRSKSVAARVCFCLKEKDSYRIGFNCSLEEFLNEGTA